jgi:hypothetical protein
MENFYLQTALPTTTSLDQSDGTAQRLSWLIQHDLPLELKTDEVPPKLVRTYSNYGIPPEKYDPMWEHEKQILKSFFKSWDVSRNQIIEALKILFSQRQSFIELLQYIVNLSTSDIEIIYKNRLIILQWFDEMNPIFHEYHFFNVDEVSQLRAIFKVIVKFLS